MIKHIVWWTLSEDKEDASPQENAAKMCTMLKNLEGKIEGLQSIEASSSFLSSSTVLNPSSKVSSYVILQSVHDNAEALEHYQKHPEHVKVGEFIKKVVSGRSAIDYKI